MYTKLDVSRREIRLIRLKARHTGFSPSALPSFPDPIICELYIYSLDKKIPYETLSYLWGTNKERTEIIINDIPKTVTSNLGDALNHLREDTVDKFLWVDAICINQDDPAERTQQVLLMGEIYSTSSNTIAWLGPQSNNSHSAVTELHIIGEYMINSGASNAMIRMTLEKDFLAREEAKSQLDALTSERIKLTIAQNKFPITAVRQLLERPYWRRAWILQEVAVSAAGYFRCGDAKIDFEYFHGAVLFLALVQQAPQICALKYGNYDMQSWDVKENNFCQNIAKGFSRAPFRVSGLRKNFRSSATTPDRSLFRILTRYYMDNKFTTEATDPRDKIYALLGLATDAEELAMLPMPLLPNYSEDVTPADVYTQAARALILKGEIDLLCLNKFPKTEPDTMPSWAPDWRKKLAQPFREIPWEAGFMASGQGTSPPDMPRQLSARNHLTLYGYYIDTIVTVGTSWKPEESTAGLTSDPSRIKDYLSSIHSLCNASYRYSQASGDDVYAKSWDREEAYFRIPVADQTLQRGMLPAAQTEYMRRGHEAVIKDVLTPFEEREPLSDDGHSYYIMMAYQESQYTFVSKRGLVGLGPDKLAVGNVMVIFQGGQFPYLLRANGDSTYRLLGAMYVHGIMYGEEVMGGNLERREFVLA